MKKPKPSEIFLFYKRSWKNYIRRIENRHPDTGAKSQKARPYSSIALNLIRKKYPKKNIFDGLSILQIKRQKKKLQRMRKIKIPSTFSIINDPINALKTILEFVEIVSTESPCKLYYDHGKLREYDLGAESILDYLSEEYQRECDGAGKKLKIKGEIRKDHHLLKFMKGIGILNSLEIQGQELKDDDLKTIEIFKKDGLRYNRKAEAFEPSSRDLTVKEFVNHINNCLAHTELCLTHDARQALSDYLAEIIDNIEWHSGCRTWRILGYLNTEERKATCEIVIFNFGKSFAESMLSTPKSSYSNIQLDKYLDHHRDNYPNDTSKYINCLVTIYALQEYVSALNIHESDTRGMGTMDFIDFFQRIHDSCKNNGQCAKMAILSGDVHILFDGKYRTKTLANNGKGISFNAENDILQPFDKEYVKLLTPYSFPGTIVSIRFPLYNIWTKGMSDGNNNDN